MPRHADPRSQEQSNPRLFEPQTQDSSNAEKQAREYGERPHGVGNFESNYDLASAQPRRIDSAIGGWNDHRGKGPKGYRASDERVRERLCEMLTDDPRIDATDIDVHVQEGNITLTGLVDSRRTKFLVEELVANTCDTEVTNRLNVRRPEDSASSRERARDWPID